MNSSFYDQAGFMAGKDSLTEIETNALGDVSGKSLLHLQCHFGQDSLSLARRGARVTGIDFSDKAIDTARQINDQLGLDATFLVSDVYSLPEALEGTFDIVFSTFGAIPWLPDLEKWAAVVGHFLKPGGVFYLAEFHPTLYMFNFDSFKVEYSYFNENTPYEEVVTGTYADPDAPITAKEFFWNHDLAEVIGSLMGQGLKLVEFREYDYSPYSCFPNMVEKEPGRFVWGNFGVRLPHVFSVKMLNDFRTT